MLCRPAIRLFKCHGSKGLMTSALLGHSQPAIRLLPPYAPHKFLTPAAKLFSSKQALDGSPTIEENVVYTDSQSQISASKIDDDASSNEKPWFLQVEPPRHPPSLHKPTLPKAPNGVPSLVEPMIQYIFEDMGLDDIWLMDLREIDPPSPLGENLIMLFATARSERHLHVACGRLARWVRKKHKLFTWADGLIGPRELKTKIRRLQKKAKLMGNNTLISPDGENGFSSGWVCVKFAQKEPKVSKNSKDPEDSEGFEGSEDSEGRHADETANFDASGRLSGFGQRHKRTTVAVQCMTESKRNQLDLETLWRKTLKKNLAETMKIQGRPFRNEEDLEAAVSSRIQRPMTASADQWQKLQQASSQQQRRQFHTDARRLQPEAAQDVYRSMPNNSGMSGDGRPMAESPESELRTLQRQITTLQISGTSFGADVVERLISAVFHVCPSLHEPLTRLQLADQLLLSAEERGMVIRSQGMLVALIEAIVSSPAYGAELERAQTNVEYLLLHFQTALEHGQTMRLMAVYAERRQWKRFWNAFRAPSRFLVARSPEMYELAYRVMASTQDSGMCADALRWVYPEMLREEAPVAITGPVYDALKACILVADPAAEEVLRNPPPMDSLDLIGRRKLQRREFVRVLKQAEELRRHVVGKQARDKQTEALHRLRTANGSDECVMSNSDTATLR